MHEVIQEQERVDGATTNGLIFDEVIIQIRDQPKPEGVEHVDCEPEKVRCSSRCTEAHGQKLPIEERRITKYVG